jgi:hypothetical protein
MRPGPFLTNAILIGKILKKAYNALDTIGMTLTLIRKCLVPSHYMMNIRTGPMPFGTLG